MLLSDGRLKVQGDVDDIEDVIDEIGDAVEEVLQIAANLLRQKLQEIGTDVQVVVEV